MRDEMHELPPIELIFGHSEAMRRVREHLGQIALAEAPVLIQGSNGCGKEMIARWIHANSPRRQQPFVKVHCPAIPSQLLESELFGHEAGSFTGAVRTKPGRAEEADGGILFLDEIGDLELGLQAKLLQLLQDGQLSRLGGETVRSLDAHFICSTNRDLKAEVQAGRFRADLFYRINVVTVSLPPLRERKEDISALAAYLLANLSRKYGRPVEPLSHAVIQLLVAHAWPGNIRELENLLNRFVIFGTEDAITAELLGERAAAAEAAAPSPSLRKIARQASLEAQRRVILDVLHSNHWNRRLTARELRISYRALLYKIRDTGIPTRRSLQPLPAAPPAPASLNNLLPTRGE